MEDTRHNETKASEELLRTSWSWKRLYATLQTLQERHTTTHMPQPHTAMSQPHTAMSTVHVTKPTAGQNHMQVTGTVLWCCLFLAARHTHTTHCRCRTSESDR